MIELRDSQVQENAILQAAQHMVVERYNEQHDPRLVYHNYHHTAALVEKIIAFAQQEQASEETKEIAQLAAWFVNIGYLEDYSNPYSKSIERVSQFLEMNNYPLPLQDRVVQCLLLLKEHKEPILLEQKLLKDALSSVRLSMFINETSGLFRLEEELIQKRHFSHLEWVQLQLQQLMQLKFYLPSAKKESEPIVAQQILQQKKIVEKANNPRFVEEFEAGKIRKFQSIERKMPNSATQTFFRTNYRNHINLSAIADNKANIMISVNAILISVLISVLSYGNIMETRPMILMPVIIFLICGLTSLIFAVLSARPKVTSLNKSDTSLEEAKQNIVFFGNFVNLNLDQYEAAMDAMFRNSELIYGNMTRDLYYLGKVLNKKYRYLSISYTIFMIGFATTVILFLVAVLM